MLPGALRLASDSPSRPGGCAFAPPGLPGSAVPRSPAPSRSASALSARTYARLYGALFWPAWERLVRGRATARRLDFVESMQWQPADAIECYQTAALRDLLTEAQRHVPYWREVFATVGFDPRGVRSKRDLDALPVLTREIVRERYRDLVNPVYEAVNLRKGTSGSTGAPLKFEYSPESESWRQAIRIRGYSWSGYRPGLPTFYYWALVSAPPRGSRGLKIRFDRTIKRETFVDSMHQDERARRRALELFRRARPAVVVCYTQSCAQFARWILDGGLRDWDDVPVLCGAEAVLEADRAILGRAFGPDVFETYGSRETMLLAAECEAHDGMHLMEENVVVEVTRDGKALPPGETGDVLVTDLHNYGMPFIRYRNGDVATSSRDEACSCGRGLRKIQRVDGRRADTLIDRDGNPIPGIVFHVLLSDARLEIVRQFQAVQRRGGAVVLRVVRGPDWSADRFEKIARRFGEYLRGLPFEVEFVDSIPPSPTGKMRTIVVER